MKKILVLLLVLVLGLSMLTGCGEKAEEPAPVEKAPVKVGFIYVGPIGDGGYTYAHDQGRLYMENELGIEAIYQENVEESAQAVETCIENFVDQGVNVIFGTSFGYMEPMQAIASKYPDVAFMHCSGYLMADNMGNYFGAMEEARYLAGIVAGLKTETNKLGYVAAYDIPEVVRGINAYTLGAQSVNPDVTVDVVWTETWYDPAKEKEAAKALLDNGCDVIAQHQDTTGPQIAAEERGVFAIGYNTDSSKQVPGAFLTAPMWNWGPYYTAQVQKVMDGEWTAESYYGNMADGIVELAPLTDLIAEGTAEAVDEAKAAIMDGSLQIFAGPIKAQDGTEKVAEGAVLTLDELLSMQWFVQGVNGTIGDAK